MENIIDNDVYYERLGETDKGRIIMKEICKQSERKTAFEAEKVENLAEKIYLFGWR